MLTVCIICKNEEANIARCLESVRFSDEIIVLDSGSTDNTLAIVKQYTANVFSTDWQGYGVQKQRALMRATHDWVLNLDADEFLTEALQIEIKQAITDEQYDAYRVPIKMHFYNQPLNYSMSPKRHLRLFRRANAVFSNDIVHEKIILPKTARLGRLRNPILHHSFRDVSHAIYKLNKYSSYSAKTKILQNKQQTLSKTVLASCWMFFRCYILQRGFLDGKTGLLFAAYNAHGTFYRGIKQLYPDAALDTLPSLTHKEKNELKD